MTNQESERLIPCIPAGHGYSSFQRSGQDNGAMAEHGVSQHQLVEEGGVGQPARKAPQYIAALAATLGALAAGSMLGWSSPVGPQMGANSTSDRTAYNFPISESQKDLIASLVNLGAAAVCFPIGIIMDKIGRRLTMLWLVLPFTIGWVLIIWAVNVPMIMIGRFVTGMAGGAFCVTAPTYTSEIAQAEIRGSLGSFFQLMITIGILFAYVIGSYVSAFIFSILCGLIPLVFGVVFFFMPESPSYLVVKGRYEEAKDALIRLRGPNYDCNSELQVLQEKEEDSKANPVSFRSAITKKPAIKAAIICFALMLFQQLSGINAVIFNTTSIFEASGAAIPSAIATILIGVMQVIATFVSSLIVDKLGRRILLLFSAFVMVLCGISLGIFFYLKDVHGANSEIVAAISWLPVVALSLFIVSFSLGFGPIPWMIAGELCGLDIKAFISAAGGTFNWLLSFAVTSTFNSLIRTIGNGQVFWLFAVITAVGFVFVFFFVIETKGKTLDEIQIMLGGEPRKQSGKK